MASCLAPEVFSSSSLATVWLIKPMLPETCYEPAIVTLLLQKSERNESIDRKPWSSSAGVYMWDAKCSSVSSFLKFS